MELKNIMRVGWRWAWLMVGLPVLVGVLGLARPAAPAPQSYVATMRFTVGVSPELHTDSIYGYDRYYTWLTAEYLADDLTEVVRSAEVAQAVKEEAALQGLNADLPPGAIQGATSGGKQHRILSVSMNWGNREQLVVLSQALADVLAQGRPAYFEQFRDAGTPVVMHLIDPPSLSTVGASLRSRMELPLRLGLALIGGVALAFFLEYLDDSVHGPRDLKAAGLEVLGTIPRPKSWPMAGRER